MTRGLKPERGGAQTSPDMANGGESPAEAQRPRSPLLFWRRGRSPREAGREGEQSADQKVSQYTCVALASWPG
jgi:hypothetical protein